MPNLANKDSDLVVHGRRGQLGYRSTVFGRPRNPAGASSRHLERRRASTTGMCFALWAMPPSSHSIRTMNGKLGVNSRTQTIAQAQILKLL